jgi:hypothetical protein
MPARTLCMPRSLNTVEFAVFKKILSKGAFAILCGANLRDRRGVPHHLLAYLSGMHETLSTKSKIKIPSYISS